MPTLRAPYIFSSSARLPHTPPTLPLSAMSATTTRLAALASQLSSPLAPNPASTAASLARRRKRMAQEQAEADGGDDQPLKGVTVVEMAMVIAAPQACVLMADMGARVIKVEPPKGEITRNEGLRDGVDKRGEPFTAHFETLNRCAPRVAPRALPPPSPSCR